MCSINRGAAPGILASLPGSIGSSASSAAPGSSAGDTLYRMPAAGSVGATTSTTGRGAGGGGGGGGGRSGGYDTHLA